MKSIYKRLVIIFTIFLFALLFSGYLVFQTYENLNKEVLKRTALLLGKAVEDALYNQISSGKPEELSIREKNRLRNLMNSITSESGSIIHILLINTEMTILLSSDNSIEGHKYTSLEEIKKLQISQPTVLSNVWENNFQIMDVIIPLKNKEQEIFSYLRLELSHQRLSSVFQDLSLIFIPITVVFAILIAFSVIFISRGYEKPLESMKKMADNLDKGDFSFRLNYSAKDEFTDVFSRIDKSIEKVNVLSESYKQAEKQIQALMQAVDETVVMLDKELKVKSYNEKSSSFFKLPGNQNFEEYFTEIISINGEFKKLIRACLEGQLVNDEIITIWLPNDQDIQIKISSQIFWENEQISGLLITFKNLRSLMELQNNLQKSMKFGIINNLASSISHEIKNPLASMGLNVQLIQSILKTQNSSEDVNHSLKVIQNEINRLNNIIHQFLNLARGKKTKLEKVSLNELVEDVLVLVKQQATERQIVIDKELQENLTHIYGDQDQLKQVLLNIILNAFQAIEHKGKVFIKSRSINRRILLDIRDSGKGMPEEVQQKIFDLYFTTKSDGSGIGLAVCNNIVKAHEGRLTFESTEGEGTVFKLDFPEKEISGIHKKSVVLLN